MSARWHGAVICQVYVRGFADGNGDGVGDLIGVRDRLPSLARLASATPGALGSATRRKVKWQP